MLFSVKCWPTGHRRQQQARHCVLELDSENLSILLVYAARRLCMRALQGSVSQCSRVLGRGALCFSALLSGRGYHFYRQLRGGKDLEGAGPVRLPRPGPRLALEGISPKIWSLPIPSLRLSAIPSVKNKHPSEFAILFSCDGDSAVVGCFLFVFLKRTSEGPL